jgi:hypothetical protein
LHDVCGCCAARISSIFRLKPYKIELNVNSIMLNERAKREQLSFLYSLKASKRHVAKLHVFECDLVQTCWRYCAARISSILRIKPPKLDRMSIASC